MVVEAAGIEPASEGIQHQVTTCLSSSICSSRGAGRGRAPRNHPRSRFAHRPQGRTGSLSRLVGAPETPQERAPGTACLSIRPRLLKVLQLSFSTGLTRWVGPRHANCVSLPPSRPIRPHTPFHLIIGAWRAGCQPDRAAAPGQEAPPARERAAVKRRPFSGSTADSRSSGRARPWAGSASGPTPGGSLGRGCR